jgi:hypothetical protein
MFFDKLTFHCHSFDTCQSVGNDLVTYFTPVGENFSNDGYDLLRPPPGSGSMKMTTKPSNLAARLSDIKGLVLVEQKIDEVNRQSITSITFPMKLAPPLTTSQ